ncbi:deoxynucleotidyltransferase terminal-interacting protein 2 [Rhinophrynus dorsalis]
MVATRRGTRVDPEEQNEEAGTQTEMEVETPASQVQTRSRAKRDSESEDVGSNSRTDAESSVTNLHSDLPEPGKLGAQIVTRRRRRSGQSDADVSEAESTSSSHSTRMTRSRQSLAHLTDSARKLRSHRSVVVTEPIMESKEDGEISEAESDCSSLSTRATRRQQTRSTTSSRSRKSIKLFEQIPDVKEDVDVSEAESNCSSVSGLRLSTRSKRTRGSTVKCPSPPQTEEISDAESCSSGISENPIAQRLRQREKCKSQSEEDENANKSIKQGHEELDSPRKQRSNVRGVKVTETSCPEKSSSESEQKILSSPRRSLRNKQVTQSDDNIIVSVIEPQGKENKEKTINASEDITEKSEGRTLIEEEEVVLKDKENLVLSPSAPLEVQSPAAQDVAKQANLSEEKIQSSQPAEELMDVEQATEANCTSKKPSFTLSIDSSDSDILIMEGTSDDTYSTVPQSTDVLPDKSGSPHSQSNKQIISLLSDSDDSGDSEQSDDDNEEDMEEEEEEEEEERERLEEETINQPSDEVLGDGLFVIDTAPGLDTSKKYYVDQKDNNAVSEQEESEEEEPAAEEDFIDEDEDAELLNKPKRGFELSTSIDTGLSIKDLGGLYISFDCEKPNPGPSLLQKMKKESKKKEEILQKSVITPDFEKKEKITPYKESIKKVKKQRREEREKTTGHSWFNMKAPEMTEELKNDLKALKMRSAMDPKRFYKKNDREGFPKYFQVATVVDTPVDYYHSRIPKKERKRTIVEELLADSEFRRYNKKKYQEIMAEKAAIAEGKKNRKKKKFRK